MSFTRLLIALKLLALLLTLFLMLMHSDHLIDQLIAVVLLFKTKVCAGRLLTCFDHRRPSLALEQSLSVANHKEEVARTCYRHVQTTHICEEAQAALNRRDLIRSDAVEDHNVFLATLEGIYRIYLNIRQLAVHTAKPGTKCILQILHMSLVWSDNRNFTGEALVVRPALAYSFMDKSHEVQSELDFIRIVS